MGLSESDPCKFAVVFSIGQNTHTHTHTHKKKRQKKDRKQRKNKTYLALFDLMRSNNKFSLHAVPCFFAKDPSSTTVDMMEWLRDM